eukprot:461303-Amorphochlora_amoeboformis.AAC.2
MKSDGPARVGVPLSIQGDEVFYILGALTVVTAVLVRTMTLLSCTLALVLLAVPLYGIVVAGVPFSIDLVISFERSQSWPVGRAANRRAPAVSLQATQEQVERPVRREKLGSGKSSNMIPGDLGVRSDKSFDDAKNDTKVSKNSRPVSPKETKRMARGKARRFRALQMKSIFLTEWNPAGRINPTAQIEFPRVWYANLNAIEFVEGIITTESHVS